MFPIDSPHYLRFPQPLRSMAERLRAPCYYAALALFQILTEFFSSNIQSTLPGFSRLMRFGLMGLVSALLIFKFVFLTAYQSKRQFIVPLVLMAFSILIFCFDSDFWFVAVVLFVIAGKDVDVRKAFWVYFCAGAASLLAVFLLHFTPLIPYMIYGRNYDFGFGHYNGYAGRLLGLFVVWMCLRFTGRKARWYDALIPLFLFCYCFFLVGARGASVTMLIVVFLMLVTKFIPNFFSYRLIQYPLVALCPIFLVCDILVIRFFDLSVPLWNLFNRFTSDRLRLLQTNANIYPITLFGGNSTNTGGDTCLDNTYFAVFINKGIFAALLLYVALMVFMWVLLKKGATVEICCLIGMLCYGLTENKLLQLTCNPLFLLMPGLLYFAGINSFPTLSVTARQSTPPAPEPEPL